MEKELETVQHIYSLIIDFLVVYAFQITGAVIILVAGLICGGWVSRLLLNVLEKRQVDITLRQLMASAARLVVIVMFAVIALSKLGISITPLIAAIGGLAVGASFAIQGPVSNYGAGLVIILTRMFRVGDTISVQGCSGIVSSIDLATTHLQAEDGEDIIIPNKHIVGEIHRNSYANRLYEGRVYLDPTSDPTAAADAIRAQLTAASEDSALPPPLVGIENFLPGAVVVGYRFWIPSAAYFETSYKINDRIYRALDDAGSKLAALSLSGAG